MKKKTLLKTSKYFTYDRTIKCYGINVEVYNDDYGQSVHIAYVDSKGKIKEYSLGTYCPFIEAEARSIVANEYYGK